MKSDANNGSVPSPRPPPTFLGKILRRRHPALSSCLFAKLQKFHKPAQRAALDELNDASVKAAEGLKTNCPTYQTLTPTGRVQAMEKRLDATLGAAKTVQPALAKFYNSLSDEQKARFNSLRSTSRREG